MFQRLPSRDNPYRLFAAFGKSHYDYSVSQKSNSIPTIFPIIRSRIKSHSHRGFKDFLSIGEVKAMLANILLVFVFIPFKVHLDKPNRTLFIKTILRCLPQRKSHNSLAFQLQRFI